MLKMAARGWESESSEEDTSSKYYCWYYFDNNDAKNNKSYAEDSQVKEIKSSTGEVTYQLIDSHTGSVVKDSLGNPVEVYAVVDKDGVDGVAIINQKVSICRKVAKIRHRCRMQDSLVTAHRAYIMYFLVIDTYLGVKEYYAFCHMRPPMLLSSS